jgi:hypothetical protein
MATRQKSGKSTPERKSSYYDEDDESKGAGIKTRPSPNVQFPLMDVLRRILEEQTEKVLTAESKGTLDLTLRPGKLESNIILYPSETLGRMQTLPELVDTFHQACMESSDPQEYEEYEYAPTVYKSVLSNPNLSKDQLCSDLALLHRMHLSPTTAYYQFPEEAAASKDSYAWYDPQNHAGGCHVAKRDRERGLSCRQTGKYMRSFVWRDPSWPRGREKILHEAVEDRRPRTEPTETKEEVMAAAEEEKEEAESAIRSSRRSKLRLTGLNE